MRDVRDSLDDVGPNKNDVNLAAALYRRRLVRIGSINNDKITTDMLLDMHQCDFEAIEAADSALKKKLSGGAKTVGK